MCYFTPKWVAAPAATQSGVMLPWKAMDTLHHPVRGKVSILPEGKVTLNSVLDRLH